MRCRHWTIGNHDDYEVAYELRDSGIRFLDGRRHVLAIGDHALELIGLPGARRYELEAEMVERLPARSADMPRIVLSHYPDHLRRAPALNADLFLAGHTHGGQICLPGGMPLMWHDTLPRRLASGVHRVNNTWLAVSRGMGVSEVAMRIFSPPEVLELRLCRGEPRVRPPSAG